MSEDAVGQRSVRSARESIRWLIKRGGATVSARGLHIERDPRRFPNQLEVDEVYECLEILGVPENTMSLLLKMRGKHAYFEIHVDNDGLDHLVEIYPILGHLRAAALAEGGSPG